MATKLKVKRAAALPGSSPHVGLGEVQLGQSGLKRSYGYIYEELLPQLQGRKAINVFQEMAQNSSVIGGVLFAINMFMRKVPWRVEAASDADIDQKKAQFLESCKDDMGHTWSDFISEINSMLTFGWSWFEIIYKQRFDDELDDFGTAQSKFNDGMIGWKKFMPISQDSWWRWDFDPESGECIGMWQRPAPDYSERYLPMGKSLHFRTTSQKDNPEGASILRTAYRSWYFLKRIEEIEAVGVERDLAGIPIATVPAEMLGEAASDDDKAMVQSIIKLVQNVRRDEQEGIVWPQAYDEAGHELYSFKLLTSGGTRQFPTQEIITRYEQRIAMTALADFLLLGNDSNSSGSYALATSKSSMFQSALETWLNGIENVLNDRAIPLLFRQNGINSGPYPKFRHDIVQKPTLPDLATLISSMAGAGAQLFPDLELENHLREYAELPIREPNEVNVGLEDKILNQQLDAQLASAEAEEALADRSAKDANAEGIVPTAQGSIVARMEPLTMKPPAQGASGAVSGAPGGSAATTAKPTGVGGKQQGSTTGAPTKSTGPVKSTKIPNNRRTTVNSSKNTMSARASKNSGPKATGGMKNRSVAKNMQDTAGVRKRVQRQMSENFPKHSMKWMKDAVWNGPVTVPSDMLDFSHENSWAASHEPDKVKAFTKKVKAGVLKPIVAVKTPGSHKLKIVDGHHHALAYRAAGHDPLVYIGHVDENSGPWDTMHDYQQNDEPVTSLQKSIDQLRKSTDVVMVGGKYKGSNAGQMIHNQDHQRKSLDNSSKPTKKCDFCQRKATKLFMVPGSTGVMARSCSIHAPQARAEMRWSMNNQVSPVNPAPYQPFPRVMTQ